MATKTKQQAAKARGNKASGKKGTLHDLLITKLCSLYDIENEIIKALPVMAKNATDSALREAFTSHLEETKGQVRRLEEAGHSLDTPIKKLKVEAIRGLVKDAQWVIKNVEKGPALDAALIAAAQYVEHYEMAGYGSARSWAQLLQYDEAAKLLQETLDEEEGADSKLNSLAMSHINEEVPMKEAVE